MSITVHPDVIGGSAREDGSGLRITRLFRVAGIRTAADNFLAVPLSLSQIPQIGEQHPRRPDLVVLDRDVSMSIPDPNAVLVTVNYGPPDALSGGGRVGDVTRSLRAELITEETTTDVDGQKMITRYVNRATLISTTFSVTTLVHRVQVQRPSFSLVWERIEGGLPTSRAFAASGKVNARTWQGKPADTWLMAISSTQDHANRFRTSYTATYLEQGWQAVLNHTEGGLIPIDVDKRNGVHQYQVYERYDFARLGLP